MAALDCDFFLDLNCEFRYKTHSTSREAGAVARNERRGMGVFCIGNGPQRPPCLLKRKTGDISETFILDQALRRRHAETFRRREETSGRHQGDMR